LFLTAALSFKKGFSTRTLTEFGREPLLLVPKFQYVVEGFLEKFGFSGPLLTALNARRVRISPPRRMLSGELN
jgi:hypothetical protein